MTKEKSPARQGPRYIFYFLMLAILGWFIFMQFFGADERTVSGNSPSLLYPGTFTWEKSDGTTEEITVPGSYDVPAGETMVITSTLPADFDASSIAIRSSLQDINIYIDGTLREQYSTSKTRLIGKNSASRFIFCSTSHEDAGKELRIELTTILFSLTLGFMYHTSFDMEYLGWCMIMGATWMLGESKIRQLLIPNSSALASLCFVMILLGPIPLLLYADNVQNGLHRRLYHIVIGISLLDFTVCSILAIANIADYIETLPLGQIILIGTFLMVFIHLCLYIRHRKKASDHLLLLAHLLVLLCVAAECVSVYFVTSLSGLFIGIGMLILLFVNIVRTLRSIQHIENTRQQLELEHKQKQTENLSLQMMQTLSTTIEAKDEYTRGHSYRVAEYAALIAAELGWSSEEIQQLKHAAYLHDIGKIGIPDLILNKPSRLTEDEYNLIKKHTIIGAEILKDITFVPHIVEVARNHHERYDGNGYPDGLSGVDIPIHARITAMADSYDAMNSRRIYRNALPPEMIREEISKNRGKQFEEEITDVFLKLIDENRLILDNQLSPETETAAQPEIDNTISKFISDVVTTIKNQEETKHYDLLTGLPMRALGEQLIAEFMKEHSGCLVFLDMDNLKKINDIHGHKAGDRALKNLGNLLSRYTIDGLACRLGGDEFLLFLPDVTAESVSDTMAQLFKQFHAIAQADTEIRYASLSAGLCLCTIGDTFADCYAKADKALYFVKQNGKNQFSFYQQINYQAPGSASIARDLRQIADSLRQSGSYAGALDLNRQYEYMNQLIIRSSCRCYLVMVTMETAADTLPHIEEIEQALSQMEQSIRQTIRRVDVCTRYSAMQYLIILFEPIETQIPNIMDRIFIQYYKHSKSHSFQPGYEYLTMTEMKENDDK